MSIPEKIKEITRAIRGKSCAAVILAAGSGERFSEGDRHPKQFAEICGKPMLVYSLEAFDACDSIGEIIIVSRRDDGGTVKDILKKYPINKPHKVVAGGKTRQESALIGFRATDEKYSHIAIHDAARPLITPRGITLVVSSAFVHKAAIAASPSVDTPKIVTNDRKIRESAPERSKIWMAQTPQVFERTLYQTAAYYAREKGFECTDDSSLCEYAGFYVKVVDIDMPNMKVTYPHDIMLAELLIKLREQENSEKSEKAKEESEK